MYQSPAVLAIDNDNGEPVFGELLSIYYFDQFIFFYVEKLSYLSYLSHFHAHLVSTESTELRLLVHYDNLLDELPYGLYLPPFMSSSDSCRFIVTKSIMYES